MQMHMYYNTHKTILYEFSKSKKYSHTYTDILIKDLWVEIQKFCV